MISIEEARQIIHSHVSTLEPERVDISRATGRVLAQSILSDAFYPSGDRATMDGYVIGADDAPGSFTIVGEIPAGVVPDRALAPGETMRIFTGALIPERGGRVIMQEDAERQGDRVSIKLFSENRFIRPQGSEARPGDLILPAGSKLNAAEIAILAQVGAVQPLVIRRPVVRHLATGNELVGPEQTPGPGQIRDTNSSLLAALIGPGMETIRVVDHPAAISAIVEGDWDLLLVSGGASVGDYDFGAEALRRRGFEIHFDRVNLRPGKPLTFATRGRQAAFIIPGNPVSHFVCYQVAILLAVERLAGLPPAWNPLSLELIGESPKADVRDSFHPASIIVDQGRLKVSLKHWSTSGDTFSLAGTHALARVNGVPPREGFIETHLLNPIV